MTVQNLIRQLERFNAKSEVLMLVEYPSGDPEFVSVKASRHRRSSLFGRPRNSSDLDLVLIETET